MASITVEIPSKGFDNEQKDYLVRQFVKINSAFATTNSFQPRYTLPNKYQVGDVYYFAAAIPAASITGEGLWLYKTTGWTLLA